jgi:hypothetical protein
MTARTRFPGSRRLLNRAAMREGSADGRSIIGRIWDRVGFDLQANGGLWGGGMGSFGDFVYLTLPWDDLEGEDTALAEQTAAQVVRRVGDRRRRAPAARPVGVEKVAAESPAFERVAAAQRAAARPLQRLARAIPATPGSHEGRLLASVSTARGLRAQSVVAEVARVDASPSVGRERALERAVASRPRTERIAARAAVAEAPRLGAAPVSAAAARLEGVGRGDRAMRPLVGTSPALVALQIEEAPAVTAEAREVGRPGVVEPVASPRVAPASQAARTQQRASRAGPEVVRSEVEPELRSETASTARPRFVEPATAPVRLVATARVAVRASVADGRQASRSFERGARLVDPTASMSARVEGVGAATLRRLGDPAGARRPALARRGRLAAAAVESGRPSAPTSRAARGASSSVVDGAVLLQPAADPRDLSTDASTASPAAAASGPARSRAASGVSRRPTAAASRAAEAAGLPTAAASRAPAAAGLPTAAARGRASSAAAPAVRGGQAVGAGVASRGALPVGSTRPDAVDAASSGSAAGPAPSRRSRAAAADPLATAVRSSRPVSRARGVGAPPHPRGAAPPGGGAGVGARAAGRRVG